MRHSEQPARFGAELAGRIAHRLPLEQRAIWEEEGPYAEGQPLGEAVVHFCVRILTLRRVVCFAARTRNRAPFVLAAEWLGHPIPDTDPETARGLMPSTPSRSLGR